MSLERALALYERLAPSYDAETRFIAGIRRTAIRALALQPGETVLDAGCGTGWCIPPLREGIGETGLVIGFEPSPHMLERARERVRRHGFHNVALIPACGTSVRLPQAPDAVLFSYVHDLMRSREALANVLGQLKPRARVVACSTKLFPRWFAPGNWYLRRTHQVTITNFESFEAPWTLLAQFCDEASVRVHAPGSRYVFRGRLRAAGVP